MFVSPVATSRHGKWFSPALHWTMLPLPQWQRPAPGDGVNRWVRHVASPHGEHEVGLRRVECIKFLSIRIEQRLGSWERVELHYLMQIKRKTVQPATTLPWKNAPQAADERRPWNGHPRTTNLCQRLKCFKGEPGISYLTILYLFIVQLAVGNF